LESFFSPSFLLFSSFSPLLDQKKNQQQNTEQELNNLRTQRELEQAKEQLETFKSKKKLRMNLELRLEQLQMDNARLCKMLASTGLFSEFFKYNKEIGGLAYVPLEPIPRASELINAPVTYKASVDV
jgi:exonuclease VII large subunit